MSLFGATGPPGTRSVYALHGCRCHALQLRDAEVVGILIRSGHPNGCHGGNPRSRPLDASSSTSTPTSQGVSWSQLSVQKPPVRVSTEVWYVLCQAQNGKWMTSSAPLASPALRPWTERQTVTEELRHIGRRVHDGPRGLREETRTPGTSNTVLPLSPNIERRVEGNI